MDQAENNEGGISRESILVVRKVVENIKLQLLRITQQLIVLTCFVNSSFVRPLARDFGRYFDDAFGLET